MVGWSSRNRRRTVSAPCVCKNVCPCHKPREGFDWASLIIGVVGGIVLVGGMVGLGYLRSQEPTHYIEVNGQDCVEQCIGVPVCHNVAVCDGGVK